MQIRYTRHARQRMVERKVTEQQVAAVIEAPDEMATGDEGETVALLHAPMHDLRVVYRELADDGILILTVIRMRRREIQR